MDSALIARLQKALHDRPAGRFHFRDLYGAGWEDLDIGTRVRLGHAFLDLVREGAFRNVVDCGVKKGGGRLYEKRS
nr:DUF1413 domain-containing protein [uncultured Celeribacter sp.]